jgi:hypothetical protein
LEIKPIDLQSSANIQGTALITNLDNCWSGTGYVLVNAFELGGTYYDTYLMTLTTSERGTMSSSSEIKRCLEEGIPANNVKDFLNNFEFD